MLCIGNIISQSYCFGNIILNYSSLINEKSNYKKVSHLLNFFNEKVIKNNIKSTKNYTKA